MYHVNIETGEYGVCKAHKIKCPLGESVEHYDNKEEAEYRSEIILAEQYGSFSKLRKEQNTPNNDESFTLPNAGSIKQIQNTITILGDHKTMSVNDLSEKLNVVPRQAHYYMTGAAYLGYVDNGDKNNTKVYSLNDKGKNFINSSMEQQNNLLKESIAKTPVVYLYLVEGEDSAVSFLQKRHDMSHDNAVARLNVLKAWTKNITVDDVEGFGHPSERGNKNWDTTLKNNDDNRIQEKKNGEICPTCFMEKSLNGICPNCDE